MNDSPTYSHTHCHVAVEQREHGAKLRKSDIPVDPADRKTAVYYDDGEAGGSDNDEAAEEQQEEEDSESSADDDLGLAAAATNHEDEDFVPSDAEDAKPRASRAHHTQVQRPKRGRASDSHQDSASKRQALASPSSAAARGGGGDADEMAEAERLKAALLSQLMMRKADAGGSITMIPTEATGGMVPMSALQPTPSGHTHHHGSHHGHHGGSSSSAQPALASKSSLQGRTSGALASHGSVGGDEDVRVKAREQLAVGLAKGLEEAAEDEWGEGGVNKPVAADVALEVETELYKLHGE